MIKSKYFSKRFFSEQSRKYFLDSKYRSICSFKKDATAIISDIPADMAKVRDEFAKHHINLSFMGPHVLNPKKSHQKLYNLEISYLSDDILNIQNAKNQLQNQGIQIIDAKPITIPWFPTKLSDLDKIGQKKLEVNESKEHSQFSDKDYLKRRNYLAQVAINYKLKDAHNHHVQYLPEQIQLWKNLYAKLNHIHKDSMCELYLKESEILNRELKLSERIPQLREVSDYLYSKSGFRIKPTNGILSWRQFFNSFAFKYFSSTLYIRNNKNPEYSPEADIVHQIIGHAPMLADKQVAETTHQIGLLSLGATDEQIDQLSAVYWYTFEFGVCKQKGKIKAYGGGIASSIAQMKHMLSQKPKFEKLNLFRDCNSPYPVQSLQSVFKFVQQFEDSFSELQQYSKTVIKPITTIYNDQTQQIEYDRCIEGTTSTDFVQKI